MPRPALGFNLKTSFEPTHLTPPLLLVCHADAKREHSYVLGTEAELNAAADQRGWVKISMENDWKAFLNHLMMVKNS
jgi:hypothetical protein